MRDIALLLILSASAWIAWQRPWLGVLSLTVVGYLTPQAFGAPPLKAFPAYLLVFIALAAGLVRDGLRGEVALRLPRDWRLWTLFALAAWFLFTTFNALAPFAAWPRLYEVAKSLVPLLFTLLLIDRRDKLIWLLATIALSFSVVAFKGLYWAVMSGFSDRIYGSPGGHFQDNNLFAVAVIMVVPLLAIWREETRQRQLRLLLAAMMALCVAAALSSWSRGALVTLAATIAMLMLGSRKKSLVIVLLMLGMACAALLMPEAWFSRMTTTVAYQGEDSAESRLQIWQTGLAFVLSHPLTGAGFDGWYFATQGVLDWHNSYVEMLAEHGPIGLILWLVLLLGNLVSLTRLAWSCDKLPELSWAAHACRMLRASLVAYAVGGLFLGISYWDIYFHFIAISVVLADLVRRERFVSIDIKGAAGSGKASELILTVPARGGP